MNAINVIKPYRWEGMWVFDDSAVGLVKEPFVSGADDMMDLLAAGMEGAPDELTEAATSSLIRGGGARVMQMKRVKAQPLWLAFLMLTSLGLFAPLAVVFNIFTFDAKIEDPIASVDSTHYQWIEDSNFLRDAVESMADMTAPK